jgi:hypothetical protein
MTLSSKTIENVAIDSLWIEKRPRKRVFRVIAVTDHPKGAYVNGTPAFPEPRWRREEVWDLEEFLKKHEPCTERSP